MKQLIEIEIDVPEGYRFVRWGEPKRGEAYSLDGAVGHASDNWPGMRAIIEREPEAAKVRYREPDARDVGRVVEVRDATDLEWYDGLRYIGRMSSGMFACESQDGDGVEAWMQARVADESPAKPGYRDVTEADIGKAIEVRDSESGKWEFDVLRTLCHIAIGDAFPICCNYAGRRSFPWRFARIKADQ